MLDNNRSRTGFYTLLHYALLIIWSGCSITLLFFFVDVAIHRDPYKKLGNLSVDNILNYPTKTIGIIYHTVSSAQSPSLPMTVDEGGYA